MDEQSPADLPPYSSCSQPPSYKPIDSTCDSINSPVTEEHTVIETPTIEPQVVTTTENEHNEHTADSSDQLLAYEVIKAIFGLLLLAGLAAMVYGIVYVFSDHRSLVS